MLSLVLVLYVIGMVFAIWKGRKYSLLYSLFCFIITLLFLGGIWSAMFIVVKQNDTGYLRQQIYTLTEVNKKMENWIKTIEDELSNNPELLNHMKEYLNQEIISNNEEISRCIDLQENRVKPYRWWLYFK